VLRRTYDGYRTEIETIYGQLEGAIGMKIEPAPDNWDRTYSVDFFIQVGEKYIGIQIKPIESGQALNQYQWIEMHKVNHEKFEKNSEERYSLFTQQKWEEKRKFTILK